MVKRLLVQGAGYFTLSIFISSKFFVFFFKFSYLKILHGKAFAFFTRVVFSTSSRKKSSNINKVISKLYSKLTSNKSQ